MLIFGVVGPIVSFYHIRSSSKVGIGRCSKSHLLLSAQASALFQMGNLENHGTMNCPGKSMVLRRHRACFFGMCIHIYIIIYKCIYTSIYIYGLKWMAGKWTWTTMKQPAAELSSKLHTWPSTMMSLSVLALSLRYLTCVSYVLFIA